MPCAVVLRPVPPRLACASCPTAGLGQRRVPQRGAPQSSKRLVPPGDGPVRLSSAHAWVLRGQWRRRRRQGRVDRRRRGDARRRELALAAAHGALPGLQRFTPPHALPFRSPSCSRCSLPAEFHHCVLTRAFLVRRSRIRRRTPSASSPAQRTLLNAPKPTPPDTSPGRILTHGATNSGTATSRKQRATPTREPQGCQGAE